MSIAWFLCGYTTDSVRKFIRLCAMNQFNTQIFGDGGAWSETEVLGGNALVKVSASDATLTTIAKAQGFTRIPSHFNLNDTLGDLTTAQKNAILNKILAMGYTQAEINAVLPANWQNITLRQVLNFICQRRLTPRWDEALQQVVLDGATVGCKTPDEVDAEVQ